jgi:tRNA(Ile)-lysidine synthase
MVMSSLYNCLVCNSPLSGKQRSFCSIKCKNDHFLSYESIRIRAHDRKQLLIDEHGGGCSRCGYTKALDALSFYDLRGKTLNINTSVLANSNLNRLKNRLRNAKVLCRNCVEEVQSLNHLSSRPIQASREILHGALRDSSTTVGMTVARFEQNIANIGLSSAKTIVLGVSGGVDSVVMLDLFARNYPKEKLTIAHVNHASRPESDDDESFVKALGKKYGIKFVSKKLNPHQKHSNILKNVGMSSNIEEYYRDERREFLLSTTHLQEDAILALAHNADDQAETVIMNLVRGSGPAGLSAMKAADNEIIRPLLHFSRMEILEYARARNLEWHEDKTNKDIRYNRNYIRHQILPLLHRLNPEYLENISRATKIQQEITRYLKNSSEKYLDETSVLRLNMVDKVIRYEVYGARYEKAKGSRKDLTTKHLDQIDQLLSKADGTSSIDLPGNITAIRTYDKLDFVLKIEDNKAPMHENQLLETGESVFGEYLVSVTAKAGTESTGKNYFLADSIDDLIIRCSQPGDKIRPKGFTGRKKLQDLFVNAKIDRERRKHIPVLVRISTNEVLLVPGLEKADETEIKKAKFRITISKG